MAYIPNEWKDQVVQRPKTYQMNNNDDGSVTLIDSFGLVTELGTPVNQDYMNHIEQGIAGCAIRYYSTTETFKDKEGVLNVNEEGDIELWQSLTDNNLGNPLTDTTKWEKVPLGDGGGLEVGDIGIAAFGIDESKGLRRYLNGTILTVNANTTAFVNKLKTAAALYPSLVCTETEWQAIAAASVGGQCGKFVLNYDTDGTTVLSVRLPKIIMPIQGLTNLTNLAEIVEAGVPNILAEWGNNLMGSQDYPANGAGYYKLPAHATRGSGYNTAVAVLGFNASNSNPIYGNSTTVQQEQIQYPYFIQIATGQETEVNIVNDIELNNPFTLFDSKYSNTPLYNASWLVSNGTYYSKSVYVTAYEALVVENNSEIEAGTSVTLPSGTTYVKRGLSVKLSTAEDITDYDFVLNTADETFRLPLENGLETAFPDSTIPDGFALYYYVGETVQNANLIDAGRISETFATKEFAKNAGFLSSKYQDLTLTNGAQYTAPSNGMFFVQADITKSSGCINLVNQTKGYTAPLSRISTQPPLLASTSLMVEKGDVMLINIDNFNTSNSSNRCRFYYAEGDKE